MNNPQKLIPSWVLLLIGIACFAAIANLPYGFYKLLRWIVCIGGIFAAVEATKNARIHWAWCFGLVAILFNPLFPFFFPKDIWRTLDAVTGGTFLVYRHQTNPRRVPDAPAD